MWVNRLASLALLFLVATARVEGAPCDDAINRGSVCQEANEKALALMREKNWQGIVVMQNVADGSLVVAAAAAPKQFDLAAPILPLSTVKLLVAASCLDHKEQMDASIDSLIEQSLVGGNDNAGRRLAGMLRKKVGADGLIQNLRDYGFLPKAEAPSWDRSFWREVPPEWKDRFVPSDVGHSLGDETSPGDWENALSLGEEHFTTTALHLSRFLQAIGNEGVVIKPVARSTESSVSAPAADPVISRIMRRATALKLKQLMRATVERGTARSAGAVLAGTGWSMGGKTGTGPGPTPPGPSSDGIFAGLIFAPTGEAQFTVVTFLQKSGLGGGEAARISAEMGKFLAGQ